MKMSDIYFKTGRELLPVETVEYFLEFRSVHYWNVVNKTLSEYTFDEWMVCLDEKVLLEQCLPQFFDKLDMDPLAPGYFSKGDILYQVTLIDSSLWETHDEWHEHFKTITHRALDICEKESADIEIRKEYVDAYREFLK